MENKKLSSIDWFKKEVLKTVMFETERDEAHFLKLLAQAKARHKEEIINAVVWFDDTDRRPYEIEIEVKQYYTEEFGGNND